MTAALSRLATALDPALLMYDLGLVPDPWPAEATRSDADRLLLPCACQVGKSTVVAVLALGEVIHRDGALVLLVSPPSARAPSCSARWSLPTTRWAGRCRRCRTRPPRSGW